MKLFLVAFVVLCSIGFVSAELINNPNIPSLRRETSNVVTQIINGSSGGNVTLDNTNLAYLNNTQTFTAVNNFSSNIQLSTSAKIVNRVSGAIKTTLWQGRDVSNDALYYELSAIGSAITWVFNNSIKFDIYNNSASFVFNENITAPNVCYSNGVNCTANGGGGNPFNQMLNTTSNVTFNQLNATKINLGGGVNNVSVAIQIRTTDKYAAGGVPNKSLEIRNSTGAHILSIASNGKLCFGSEDCNSNAFRIQSSTVGVVDGIRAVAWADATGTTTNFQYHRYRGNPRDNRPVIRGDRLFNIQGFAYVNATNNASSQYGNLAFEIDQDFNNAILGTGVALVYHGREGATSAPLLERFRVGSNNLTTFNGTVNLLGLDDRQNMLKIVGVEDFDQNVLAQNYTGNLTEWGLYDRCSLAGCSSGAASYTPTLTVNKFGYLQALPLSLEPCSTLLKNSIAANATGTYGCNSTAWVRLF